MCGIWASIGGDFGPNILQSVRRRGPDGEGWLEFETPAGVLRLGHRRLSIYDPTAASSQPMRRGGRLAVVFNGAIYNYQSLRRELIGIGAKFETAGDVEVVLAAYEAWGESAFSRFDGMFAIALFDIARQRLILARDRFGEKPLLLATRFRNGALLAVASDMHQLRQAGAEPWSLEPQVAADFLNLGRVDTDDRTFVQAVRKAPAGATLALDLSSSPALARSLADQAWRQFHRLPQPDPSLVDRTGAARLLREELERSVALRLEADVEVGSCLSGGLDSSGIVALTAPLLGDRKLKCFAAVFEETAPDGSSLSERVFVDAAAAAFRHAEVNVITPTGADCAAHIDDIVAAQGEPFANTSICAQWFVMEAAHAEGVKVLLDGQGADELLGGYEGMLGAQLADLVAGGRIGEFGKAIAELTAFSGETPAKWRRAAYNALVTEQLRRRISSLRGVWPPQSYPAPGLLPAVAPSPQELSRFDRQVRTMVTSLSLPGLLRYEDRNAMWHGVETRLPFLSQGVADIALRMPSRLKLNAGRTKDVLRRALADIVPESITNRRRKLGFVTPHDAWVAGPLKAWTQQRADQVATTWAGLVDVERTRILAASIGPSAVEANGASFRLAVFGAWTERMSIVS